MTEPEQQPQGRELAVALLFGAANLWGMSLVYFDRDTLASIGDLGLSPLLPWTFYASLGLLMVGFALTLRSPKRNALLAALHVLMLIGVLHATPAILYETPRYPFSYKHIGVASYVQEHGTVDPMIDAYFNWPGFFALTAFVSETAGVESAYDMAVWAPVAMNVLLAIGVLAVMYSLGATSAGAWLGVWIFLLANWVGQDYFAPQAFGYYLHLVMVSIYVAVFGIRTPASQMRLTGRARALVLLLLTLCFAAVVAAHQLTPFMTLTAVIAMLVLGRARAPMLSIVMASLLLLWFAFSAHTYFAGHLGSLAAQVGRLLDNLSVASELIAVGASGLVSDERSLVLSFRQWLALFVLVLAAAGGVRLLLRRSVPWTGVLLALLPGGLVALQSYGGEILLRVYMFALPFLAYFAAAAFVPRLGMTPRRGSAALMTISTVLLAGGMVFAYYGNESMNYIDRSEVEALDALYDTAPRGATVVNQTDNAPIRHRRYEQFEYTHLQALLETGAPIETDLQPDAAAALDTLDGLPAEHVYVLLSRSQAANAKLFGRLPGVDWEELRTLLETSEEYEAVFESPSSVLFRRAAQAQDRAATP
ncbi:MAG: hypothetical protein KF813_08185 [Trueperaceae bacterium]|nr:hypothetical protein [Trueperaceae bacterium]